MIAVAVTALAIIVQAGVLISMYLLSQRVVKNVNGLIDETRELMAPVDLVVENLKTTSADMVEVGKSARQQMQRVEGLIHDADDALHNQIDEFEQMGSDVRTAVNETVEEVRDRVMTPVRTFSAVASGIGEGIRFFFRGRKSSKNKGEDPREFPSGLINKKADPAGRLSSLTNSGFTTIHRACYILFSFHVLRRARAVSSIGRATDS